MLSLVSVKTFVIRESYNSHIWKLDVRDACRITGKEALKFEQQ